MKTTKLKQITKELRRIASKHGGLLHPEAVVEAARPVTSPLHSRFEWDDSKAAESFRLWQARQLIRVCVEQLPGVNAPTEVFVSLASDRKDQGGYRVTTQVLNSRELREEMLSDALAELEVFRLKYRHLKELFGVFRAMRKVRPISRREQKLAA